ncbi:hypothetical protein ACQP25_45305 (plasmid) [Microtetraspora malaysiensis]
MKDQTRELLARPIKGGGRRRRGAELADDDGARPTAAEQRGRT